MPLETDEVKMIKKELQHIRDTANRLLDHLEPKPLNVLVNGEGGELIRILLIATISLFLFFALKIKNMLL